ncbi:MAG: GTPase Era [Firmicutes bacterium]|uniref:GTPase Era n=1 Tax=Candidatus Gallilactobacillus intestinavium TaxID=2840838 RepID=A0A9D9E5Y8_9LACO|nr:GTPase Era [Candidatus Gallilactobacillus intestinavium]
MSNNFHSGFVAIVGRSNVGKSTFLNYLLGEKIAITSSTKQTTRNQIKGIYTSDQAQIVFIDTPGIFKPRHKLDEYMVNEAYTSLKDVDAVIFMISANEKRGAGDDHIIKLLHQVNCPVYLVINKIDQINPNALLEIMDQYRDEKWKDVYPISALLGNNVDNLMEDLISTLPEGPQYYPEDQLTDHPERFIVKEIIREKILNLTREEVPHSVAVEINTMHFDGQIMNIDANIIVNKKSHKGIIIGKNGSMLKNIGVQARKDIERLTGEHVYLKLWVKVVEHWKDKLTALKEYGYKMQK